MEEIYKIINGFENYSVSNFGNVRNDKKGKILKTSFDRCGYKRLRLNKKTFRVHCLVARAFIQNPENKKCVDHIDCDRKNNNVNNLRFVMHQDNCFNKSIYKNNKSGVKGIYWNKNSNKWHAQIRHRKKLIHLGYFKKLEDAINVRKLKANELFGEFTHHSEKIITLNIKIPKNTKLNINISVDEDEEYKNLEKEFEELIK